VKEGWQKLPFDEVVADESGGNLKTPQSEFLETGKFAVVDQGKEMVAGYVNDDSRICRSRLPVVVFGDHTRCLKFVDFPFCMGADGIKVLRPKIDADVKYLFHFLRQLHLPDGGYDRHFKYLKRSEVILPPLAEQRRIAEILDKAEALRVKRRAALAQLDSLTQSLFLDLFGDPATNPKKWPKASLNDCTEKIQIGPFGSLLHQEDYVADGIPLVNPKHIQGGVIATNHWESVTQRKYDQLNTYHLRQGDIVMGRRGEMGRCAIVSGSEQLLCGTGSLIIRPDNKSTSALLLCAILSTQQMKEAFERLSLGQTLPNLNSGIVGKFMLPLPPISLQHEFARRITTVEKLKTAQRAALAELDALFASLQHRAFRGEL